MKHLLITALFLTIIRFLVFSQDSIPAPVIKLGPQTPVSGTHVSMTPPDKFTYSPKLKGFVHPGSAASVTVTEAEGISWIQASQALADKNMSGQNTSIVSQEDITLKDGNTGRLFVLRLIIPSNDSTKQDLEFERLMLFAGDYHRTVILNSNYPALLRSLLYPTLRESMLSVVMSDTLYTVKEDEK